MVQQCFNKLNTCNMILEELIVAQLTKKFPAFYGTWRFSIMFITVWTQSEALCNIFQCDGFLWWGVFSTPPKSQVGGHPLFAAHDCLFNIFITILHIWRPLSPITTWVCAMLWWQGPHNMDCNVLTHSNTKQL